MADEITVIEDLTETEQGVLGGLIRLMVRTDGSFSEEEETAINAIGDDLGGKASLWRVISQSAQTFPNEEAVKEHVAKVERSEVRGIIVRALERIAASDTTEADEDALLGWVRGQWG